MPTPKFATIIAGALTITDDTVNVADGKSLILGQDGTISSHAVTKSQLDEVFNLASQAVSQATDAVSQATDAVSQATITANNAVTTSQFQQVYALVSQAASQANSSVTFANAANANAANAANAVSNEALAREESDTALKNVLFKHINVPLSTAVVANECSPMVTPISILNTTNVDGWYFTNPGLQSISNKINWYFELPGNLSGQVYYASVLELGIPIKLISRESSPFITIYTRPRGSEDSYHAKITFVVGNNSEITYSETNNFLLRACVSSPTPVGKFLNFTPVNLVKDNVNSFGDILPSDEILGVSIETDSTTGGGNVNCVIHGLNVLSQHDNYSYLLSNKDPLNKFLLDKTDELYNSLGQQLPSTALAE